MRVQNSLIVDERGQNFRMAVDRPHDAASRINPEVAAWNPRYFSADAELLGDLPALRARTQDLIRNNPLMSGAVQTHLDWVVGSGLKLNAKPNWHLLGVTDVEAQAECEHDIEAEWNNYAEDPACYIDASRSMRFSELIAQAYRSYLTSFEIVQTAEWVTEGNRPYNTALQSIDVARVGNPLGRVNTSTLRDGVVFDNRGVPKGCWICNRVPNDAMTLSDFKMDEWQYVPFETDWGRTLLIHIFKRERPGQSRGKNTGLIASLRKIKMHERMGEATLQATVLNAMFAGYIKSSMGPQEVGAALGTIGATGGNNDPRLNYMMNAGAFHKDSTIRFNGARLHHLYPDEDIGFHEPNYPTAGYEEFENSVLRSCAAGWNMPFEQLSRNYSQTNYTGFRAAMLTAWQFFAGEQYYIGGRYATSGYSLFLEEALMKGTVKPPPGAKDFHDNKAAWCRCLWIGPGKGTLDPLREAEATGVDLDNGLTTYEIEAANRGLDWRELKEQRAQELAYDTKLEQKYKLPEGALSRKSDKDSAAKNSAANETDENGVPKGHPDFKPAPAKKEVKE